jgi:hypothetical protein
LNKNDLHCVLFLLFASIFFTHGLDITKRMEILTSSKTILPFCRSAVLAFVMVLPLESHAQNGALLPPSPPQWPLLIDADQDGLADADEILLWLNPLDAADGLSDLDGDGLSLAWEWQIDTAPDRADTDADGWSDSDELLVHGTDPRDATSRPADAAQVQTSSASPQPSVLMNVASTTATATAPPSLINGDFTNASAPRWYDATKSTSYQGRGFKWGEGNASGWTAYRGSSIEIWQTNGQSFVELDGNKGSYGIKQPIKDVRACSLLLAWKQSGRNNPLARSDAYYVQIYYQNTSGAVQVISKTPVYQGFSKTAWTDNAHVFTIKEQDIQAAAGAPIYVAFIPEDLNTYGTLIDEVKLFPVEVAVDADRDGEITFDGKDKTTAEKPYRFWLNDDDDGLPGTDDDRNGAEKVPVIRRDNKDRYISTRRDLEDFAKMGFSIGAIRKLVEEGTIQVGLKWIETTDSPSLRLFKAYEQNGQMRHVSDEDLAEGQMGAGYQQSLTDKDGKTVLDSGGTFILKPEFWTDSGDDPVLRYVLFEGVTEGKGRIVFEFFKQDGSSIGVGGDVWLNIKDIRKMYQRANLIPSGQNLPAENPWANIPFEQAPDEVKESITFVHGWNMSPEGAESYAHTMFKRLWWRGFKGRYSAVRWRPYWSTGFDGIPVVGQAIDAYLAKYNDSEHIAWLTGSLFKDYVDELPGNYSKNIVAHSMGNIVVGSALSQGMVVDRYSLMNAAVPAACYDENPLLKQQPGTKIVAGITVNIWVEQTPDDDFDPATRNLAYRGKMKAVAANLSNFYLPEDDATSYAWELGNALTKPPNSRLGQGFDYVRGGKPGQKLLKLSHQPNPTRYLSDPHEAMPYACRTWAKAAGAEGRTKGSIGSIPINLSDPIYSKPGGEKGFRAEHSAQFTRRIQHLKPFYFSLMEKLGIPQNP